MNRAVLPLISIVTLSSIGYMIQKKFKNGNQTIERQQLLQIIITLRKSIYATLRQIAFAANCVKIEDSGLQPRKIKEIVMRDGSSAESKLEYIQLIILERFNVTRELFEYSCKHYSENDLEFKLILQKFKNDIQMAIDGTVQTYHGPLPNLTAPQALGIYRQVIWRRMKIIEQRILENVENLESLKSSLEIQSYLQESGIKHKSESSQKVFIALLEYHYKNSSEFMSEFEALEGQFEDFIEETRKKKWKNKQSSQNQQK